MSLYNLFPPGFLELSVPLSGYLILSAILFTIGAATFLFRRSVITVDDGVSVDTSGQENAK